MNKKVTLKFINSQIVKTVDIEETSIIFSKNDINKLLQMEGMTYEKYMHSGVEPVFGWSIEYPDIAGYTLNASNTSGNIPIFNILANDITMNSSASWV